MKVKQLERNLDHGSIPGKSESIPVPTRIGGKAFASGFLIALMILGTNCQESSNNDDLLLGLAIANQPQPVRMNIQATVDDGKRFESNKTVKVAGANANFRDFRFYMSEIQLVRENGTRVNVSLREDGFWQTQNIVLIDLENGKSTTGSHGGTSTGENSSVLGSIPAGTGGFTALEFTLGVPEELNHLQINDSKSPLNIAAMYWAWASGYKFAKIEFSYDSGTTWTNLHLGSTGFGTSPDPTACQNEIIAGVFGNCPAKFRPRVRVEGIRGKSLSNLKIELKIPEWLKGYSTTPGIDTCMPVQSTKEDKSCNPLVENIGLRGRETNSGAINQTDLDAGVGSRIPNFRQKIFVVAD